MFLADGATYEGDPSDIGESERIEWVPVDDVRRLIAEGADRRPLAHVTAVGPGVRPDLTGRTAAGQAAPSAAGFQEGEVGEALVVREHLDDRLVEAQAPLEPAHLELLVPQHQRDRQPGGARGGAAARWR